LKSFQKHGVDEIEVGEMDALIDQLALVVESFYGADLPSLQGEGKAQGGLYDQTRERLVLKYELKVTWPEELAALNAQK
jgi:hypothetical protein